MICPKLTIEGRGYKRVASRDSAMRHSSIEQRLEGLDAAEAHSFEDFSLCAGQRQKTVKNSSGQEKQGLPFVAD